jgi:branched-chain amino acid transport system ATP-binding protein
VTQPLLQVQNLGKRFGGFIALEGVSLSVAPGERLGLIGPNGSGKSTFVNCLGGAFARHDGVVVFAGRDLAGLPPYRRVRLGLARTFQLPRAFASLTVLENVEVPFRFLDPGGAPTSERALRQLERVGLGRKARFRPRELTQVDLRRLELARALACRPQLLLADETMAGLSHAEVDDILELLFGANADGVAIVMIEHIMRAVTAFAERLVVFVAGRAIADGPTQEILRRKDVEAAYLGE